MNHNEEGEAEGGNAEKHLGNTATGLRGCTPH